MNLQRRVNIMIDIFRVKGMITVWTNDNLSTSDLFKYHIVMFYVVNSFLINCTLRSDKHKVTHSGD